jgi:hypothetical protein
MNYSTLKKTVALSFASLMVVGMAKRPNRFNQNNGNYNVI